MNNQDRGHRQVEVKDDLILMYEYVNLFVFSFMECLSSYMKTLGA